MFGYLAKEITFAIRQRSINIPKNLLLLGTALSWFVGIVVFNNDLAFTALNVVAHGVPYMALIWIYCRNHAVTNPRLPLRRLFTKQTAPLFVLALMGLAYIEEGLWDGFTWHEHPRLFAGFQYLPHLDDPVLLALTIPLLALPQSTHYVLDAFIWRHKGQNNAWRNILFAHSPGKVKA